MNKKISKNKIAKGLTSLVTVVILLSSILASSFFYENNITANVVEDSTGISYTEVNDIYNLQLNEGWYQVKNGNVFYLESFDSALPLYIKIINPKQQNGLIVIDSEGNILFDENAWELASKDKVEYETGNAITGMAIGMEKVSGFATAPTAKESNIIAINYRYNFGFFRYWPPDVTYYKYVNNVGWQKSSDGTKWETTLNLRDKSYDDGITVLIKEIYSARPQWYKKPYLEVYGNQVTNNPVRISQNQIYSTPDKNYLVANSGNIYHIARGVLPITPSKTTLPQGLVLGTDNQYYYIYPDGLVFKYDTTKREWSSIAATFNTRIDVTGKKPLIDIVYPVADNTQTAQLVQAQFVTVAPTQPVVTPSAPLTSRPIKITSTLPSVTPTTPSQIATTTPSPTPSTTAPAAAPVTTSPPSQAPLEVPAPTEVKTVIVQQPDGSKLFIVKKGATSYRYFETGRGTNIFKYGSTDYYYNANGDRTDAQGNVIAGKSSSINQEQFRTESSKLTATIAAPSQAAPATTPPVTSPATPTPALTSPASPATGAPSGTSPTPTVAPSSTTLKTKQDAEKILFGWGYRKQTDESYLSPLGDRGYPQNDGTVYWISKPDYLGRTTSATFLGQGQWDIYRKPLDGTLPSAVATQPQIEPTQTLGITQVPGASQPSPTTSAAPATTTPPITIPAAPPVAAAPTPPATSPSVISAPVTRPATAIPPTPTPSAPAAKPSAAPAPTATKATGTSPTTVASGTRVAAAPSSGASGSPPPSRTQAATQIQFKSGTSSAFRFKDDSVGINPTLSYNGETGNWEVFVQFGRGIERIPVNQFKSHYLIRAETEQFIKGLRGKDYYQGTEYIISGVTGDKGLDILQNGKVVDKIDSTRSSKLLGLSAAGNKDLQEVRQKGLGTLSQYQKRNDLLNGQLVTVREDGPWTVVDVKQQNGQTRTYVLTADGKYGYTRDTGKKDGTENPIYEFVEIRDEDLAKKTSDAKSFDITTRNLLARNQAQFNGLAATVDFRKDEKITIVKEGNYLTYTREEREGNRVIGTTKYLSRDGKIYIKEGDTLRDITDSGGIVTQLKPAFVQANGIISASSAARSDSATRQPQSAERPAAPEAPPTPGAAAKPAAPTLTAQQIAQAQAFNKDPKYTQQREDFKKYLMKVEGLSQQAAEEVLTIPEYVAAYQKKLGFSGQDVDGKIGPKTGEAASKAPAVTSAPIITYPPRLTVPTGASTTPADNPQLKEMLTKLGFSDVKTFQQRYGLTQTGNADVATVNKINEVRDLQEIITSIGRPLGSEPPPVITPAQGQAPTPTLRLQISGNKWVVIDSSGKTIGTYDTAEEARRANPQLQTPPQAQTTPAITLPQGFVQPSQIQKGQSVKGKKVTDTQIDPSTQAVTVTLEGGEKITMAANEIINPQTGDRKKLLGMQGIAATGIRPGITIAEKPIIDGVNANGQDVKVYAPSKDGQQIIEVGGKTYIINKDILGTITETNWDGTVREIDGGFGLALSENGKTRIVQVNNDGTQAMQEESIDSKGVLTRTTVIKQGDGSGGFTGEIRTIREIGVNTDNSETIDEVRFVDGTLMTSTSKGTTLDRVVYTARNGQTLALDGKSWTNIQGQLKEKTNRFLIVAAEENFVNPVLNKDGTLQSGNRILQSLTDTSIAVIRDGIVTRTVSLNGKERITYKGDVRIAKNEQAGTTYVHLGKGASATTYAILEDGSSIVTKFDTRSQDGLTGTRIEYVRDEIIVSSTKKDANSDFMVTQSTLILKRVTDRSNPFYGMAQLNRAPNIYYNVNDGKFYTTDNKGKVVEAKKEDVEKVITKENKKDLEELVKVTTGYTPTQLASQRFFRDVERVFTEFRGLSYYATLFIDDDKLLEWRNSVDRFFSENYLGIESWTSKICASRIDGSQEGVAYAETPQGLAQIGAHIEATRTQPIVNETGFTNFIYKITFNVRNGDFEKDVRAPENMTINVLIVPQGKQPNQGIKLFKKDISIKRGSSFGRAGSQAIVKSTKNVYDKVCLTFDKIPIKWKLKEENKISGRWALCNTIVQSTGEPTTIELGTTAPAGSDADLNDF